MDGLLMAYADPFTNVLIGPKPDPADQLKTSSVVMATEALSGNISPTIFRWILTLVEKACQHNG